NVPFLVATESFQVDWSIVIEIVERDPVLGPGQPHETGERAELILAAVVSRIAGDDQSALPDKQLFHAKILTKPAVGNETEVPIVRPGSPEAGMPFLEKICRGGRNSQLR